MRGAQAVPTLPYRRARPGSIARGGLVAIAFTAAVAARGDDGGLAPAPATLTAGPLTITTDPLRLTVITPLGTVDQLGFLELATCRWSILGVTSIPVTSAPST